MKIADQLPSKVTEVPHTFARLADGTRIAVRLFLPEGCQHTPVPAILEFFPYRKSDFSCVRDAAYLGYLAGHGYACVKADTRGTGDSDGLQLDQFAPEFYADAAELVDWIARQEWCNGKVGMTGVSWPGHATLMTAARRPPALAAIAPINAADDRFLNKYQGGCFLLYGADHSPYMTILNSLPPRPAAVGESWRERWRERITTATQPAANWLAHPLHDNYWAASSMVADAAGIEAPALVVSGWADTGYAMNVGRLLDRLACSRQGLIGPWGHRYFSYPGPNIDMLGSLRRWFDHWLKGVDNGAASDPQLTAYIYDSEPPDALAATLKGRWIAEETWPPASVETRRYAINASGIGLEPEGERPVLVRTPLVVGMGAGEWLPWYVAGVAPELPADQRADDGLSVVFDSPPLDHDLEILGTPTITAELTTDTPQTQLVVRLCEVFPDGASRRVTYGFLDLAYRNGEHAFATVVPGERMRVRVPLFPTGYRFARGNRLRIAFSTSYWPIIWPTPRRPNVTLLSGASFMELPVRHQKQEVPVRDLGELTIGRGLPTSQLRPTRSRHRVEHDLASGRTTLTIDADLGSTRIEDRDIETSSVHRRSFTLVEGDPLSARAEFFWDISIREKDWEISTRIESLMFATEDTFEIDSRLDCFEGGRPFQSRVLRDSVPRRR